MSDDPAVDDKAMRRVIEYILQKKQKDDIVILFDGRSRMARKIIMDFDTRLSPAPGVLPVEIWIVYKEPTKPEDELALM